MRFLTFWEIRAARVVVLSRGVSVGGGLLACDVAVGGSGGLKESTGL